MVFTYFKNIHKQKLIIASVFFSGLVSGLIIWKAPIIVSHFGGLVLRDVSDSYSSNLEIKKRIIAEVPLLQSKDAKSEFEIVNALREWVFHTVPVADQPDLIIEDMRNVTSAVSISLGERLKVFDEREAGAWCSATASTLRDIYELFGFESYVVHTGDIPQRNVTHSFTLVNIQNNGEEMLVVQDSYRNYVLADINDNPIDYFEVLDLLQRKNDQDILSLFGQNLDKPRLISNNGKQIIREPFDQSIFDKRVEKFVSGYGYPNKFIYILLFPFGMYSSDPDRAEDLLAKAQNITGNWCTNIDDTCLSFD